MSTQPSNTITPPGASAAVYLEQTEALREEMQAAMLAIAGDRLHVLEESLWRQQVLCTSLKHLSHSLASDQVESSLMLRIRESSTALREVGRTYAALIQQSREHGDLLSRLCHSYRDAAPSTLPGVAPQRSLSCEA